MSTTEHLDVRVADDLRLLGPAPANWVPVHAGVDHDVLIVGGGQSGVTTAFALQRAGVSRVSVIDAAGPATVGSWQTKARMRNLRTAKSNRGPDLDIPSLTFQAWFEARAGRAAYDALARIPTLDWAAYLGWLVERTGVQVRHGTRLLRIERAANHFRVQLEHGAQVTTETCRKIVLATGIAGSGEPFVPASVQALPADRYAHTDASIDFAALRGRSVAIVGAASAAFDAAGTALEAGARAVHLFCRSARLTPSSNMSTLNYPGAQDYFHDLPDAVRWQLAWHFRERSPGPTAEVVARATQFENFHLYLGTDDLALRWNGAAIELRTGGALVHADHVISGTGYRVDLSRRPELTDIAPLVALWRDRYQIPAAQQTRPNALFPYLGPAYELQERSVGTAPWLADIHCFNFAAITSFGRHVGDAGSIRVGVPRLVRYVARDLFLADTAHHVARLSASVDDELAFSAYASAVVPRVPSAA